MSQLLAALPVVRANKLVATIRGFSGSYGVAVNPKTNRIYVSDTYGPGRVSVISGGRTRR